MGRAKHFEDEAELMFYFEEYLAECEESGKKANLAGFARKCYCDKDTLLKYKEEGHVFFYAMKKIYSFLEDATINNDMSDNFKKFYMTNTFKEYKDKQEIVSDNKHSLINGNDAELLKLSSAEIDNLLLEEARKLVAAADAKLLK